MRMIVFLGIGYASIADSEVLGGGWLSVGFQHFGRLASIARSGQSMFSGTLVAAVYNSWVWLLRPK